MTICYIFIILWVAHVLLLFIGWIWEKVNESNYRLSFHGNTALQHNTAIIRMTSTYLQNAWGKNRKQSTKSLIHWSQYIKIDMIQYWSFCFISPVSSGIKILPHYSEVKVICLATMTTIIQGSLLIWTLPLKGPILFIFHLSSCEIQLTYAEQCHHCFILSLFKCS